MGSEGACPLPTARPAEVERPYGTSEGCFALLARSITFVRRLARTPPFAPKTRARRKTGPLEQMRMAGEPAPLGRLVDELDRYSRRVDLDCGGLLKVVKAERGSFMCDLWEL